MRPRCAQLARVLKKTGCFYYHYYHCDWHVAICFAFRQNVTCPSFAAPLKSASRSR
jgi:hypothetical protein